MQTIKIPRTPVIACALLTSWIVRAGDTPMLSKEKSEQRTLAEDGLSESASLMKIRTSGTTMTAAVDRNLFGHLGPVRISP
jgi:hypothetical protein